MGKKDDRATTKEASLARAGKLDALFAMIDQDPASKNDRNAYKWLWAACDFGHEEAEDLISDVLEVSSMRYDDSGFETAAAHWELAVAYLEGTDGLPRDLDLARQHLERAFEHHRTLEEINSGAGETYSSRELLERLPDAARRVLEAGIAGDDYGRAIKHVETVRRLVEAQAPSVMIEDERRALREVVASLCPPLGADDIAHMGGDPLRDELAFTERTHAKLGETLALLRAELAKREAGSR